MTSVLLALALILGTGAAAVEVPDEEAPDTKLTAKAARDILRLVEGRPIETYGNAEITEFSSINPRD